MITHRTMVCSTLGLLLAALGGGCTFDGGGIGPLALGPNGHVGGDLSSTPRSDLGPSDGATAAPDAGADAGGTEVGASDLANCPVSCVNGCSGGVCELDCTAQTCTCPPGLDCSASCVGKDACGSIDCSAASSCSIDCDGDHACKLGTVCPTDGDCSVTCTGNHACDAPIVCGSGPCDVHCASENACKETVDCSASCACSVNCGDSGCEKGEVCPAGCGGNCAPEDQCDVCS